LVNKQNKMMVERQLLYSTLKFSIILFILIINPFSNQLVGSERTMEQFLDRLLDTNVYDRRIRPSYTDQNSKILN
jgi:hypothetical protein